MSMTTPTRSRTARQISLQSLRIPLHAATNITSIVFYAFWLE